MEQHHQGWGLPPYREKRRARQEEGMEKTQTSGSKSGLHGANRTQTAASTLSGLSNPGDLGLASPPVTHPQPGVFWTLLPSNSTAKALGHFDRAAGLGLNVETSDGGVVREAVPRGHNSGPPPPPGDLESSPALGVTTAALHQQRTGGGGLAGNAGLHGGDPGSEPVHTVALSPAGHNPVPGAAAHLPISLQPCQL